MKKTSIKKPNKRELAIIRLLQKSSNEGTDYAFVHYGMDDYMEELGDEKFTKIANAAIKAWKKLEDAMDSLRDEVEKSIGVDPYSYDEYEDEYKDEAE